MRLFNRESPRILANRIFLAPSCSAPADRLRRNRTPSGKMLSEKPACRFFLKVILYLCGRVEVNQKISHNFMVIKRIEIHMVRKSQPNCQTILGMCRHMSNGDGRKSGGFVDLYMGKNLATSIRNKN